jgi:hypothetical protein
MEDSYQSTTVEMDDSGYESLQKQLSANKSHSDEQKKDIRYKEPQDDKKQTSAKKYVFTKGDQSLEVDDDYEIEFLADKKPTKLSLRELKERAAGDIAVKNRMHSLAEEKKKVTATLKKFADLGKTDALAALEYISEMAKETDSEFEYQKYLELLADQAEKIGNMDEKDRKAMELEKKLKKVEGDLSHKQRVEAVALRKQELLSDYPEIGDQQFGRIVDSILENDDLMQGVKDENDIIDKAEDLIQEILTQRDIMSVIEEIDPSHLTDESLIFTLSDLLKQNPDFDEEDVRDIIGGIIGRNEREDIKEQLQNRRKQEIRTLSDKARNASTRESITTRDVSDFDLLRDQLLKKNKESQKTPLWQR